MKKFYQIKLQNKSTLTALTVICLVFLFSQTLFAQTPGGVVSNELKLWLKADAGVTESNGMVSLWEDQSGNTADAYQTDEFKQPSYTDESGFFNHFPTVDFPRTSGVGMPTGANIGTNLYSIFLVYNSTTTSTAGRRALQGSNNWLMGPYANNSGFFAGAWVYNSAPAATVVPVIATAISDDEVNPKAYFHLNGKLLSSASGVTPTLTPQSLGLGAVSANEPLGGSIAEVIAYNSLISPEERQKIESYLAIKYGITIDQSTATNYLNSAGTVVWDAAANTIYNHNIFGLANDENSGLFVEQSRSANTNLIELSNPDVLTAGDFLFLSDNGESGTPVAEIGLPGGVNYAADLTWNVSKIGNVSTVNITISSEIENPKLLVDLGDDGTFEDAYPATSTANGTYTFAGITLNNNSKIKIGYTDIIAPGGISANLALWLKADAGLTTSGGEVSVWTDQSGNNHNFYQELSTSRPSLVGSSINFNPAVNFKGDEITCPEGILGSSTHNNLNVYTVQRVVNASGNYIWMLENTAGSTPFANYLPYNNTIYWRPGSTDVTTSFNSITNKTSPTLFSFHSSTTTGQTYAGANSAIVQNGLVKASGTSFGAPTGNNSTLTFGSPGQERDVSEILIFDGPIDAGQNNKVLSYLGIKYGITIDQTTPTNYTNSAGDVVWDAAVNGAFKNRIFGIGKEAASQLDQSISQSAIFDGVTIEKPGGVAEGEYLFFSDNDASLDPVAESNLPGDALYATPRIWNVSKVGDVGAVNISVRPSITQFPILLIDNNNDGNFEEAVTDFTVTPNGNTFYNVSLNDKAKVKVGYVTLVSEESTDITIESLELPTLDACSGEGDVVIKLNNLTGSPITNVSFRDSMPEGITYVPGSVTGPGVVFASNIEGDPEDGYNVVTFSVSSLPASGSVIFTFKVRAGCSVSKDPEDITNAYTAKWADKVTEQFVTPSYEILFPSLSTQATPASISVYCYKPFTRTIRVCNGGFGSLDTVLVVESHGGNYRFINANMGISEGINTGVGTIILTAADFATVGNHDGKFDFNECITVVDTAMMIGGAGTINGTITSKWGCRSYNCVNNTSNNVVSVSTRNAGVTPGTPSAFVTRTLAPVTPVLDPTDFYDKTFYYKETLKNTSQVKAYNVLITPTFQGIFFIDKTSILATKNGGEPYYPTITYVDNALDYPSNGTPQKNMDYSEEGYGGYMGEFTNFDQVNAYNVFVGDMEPGDSIVVTWEVKTVGPIHRQHSSYYGGNNWNCANFRVLDGMRLGGGYDARLYWRDENGCTAVGVTKCQVDFQMQAYNGLSPNPVNLTAWGQTIGLFRNFSWDITNYPNFQKCAFDDGDTLKLKLRTDYISLPFYTSRSKFYIKLKVTPGVKWLGDLENTYAYLNNSTLKWQAEKVVDTHDADSTIYVYFKRANLPNNNFGTTNMLVASRFDLYVNLLNFCPGPLRRNILMTKVYELDTTKTTALVLETGPKDPQFQWYGNCQSDCEDGVNIEGHEQYRTTYGKPDNNADGVADAVGELDSTIIYRDVITLGDTLQFHTRMIVKAKNNDYSYFYMLNEFRYGNPPYSVAVPVNNFIKKDPPQITITTKDGHTYTGVGSSVPVSTDYKFLANLSLQGTGGVSIPGYTAYHDGDTVDLIQNVVYWKEHDANWNRVQFETVHTPYLSLVENPTLLQQYRCDSTICNIKITDYKKYQTTTDNYQTWGSDMAMLQIHGYGQLSPGGCGTIYFPGEVRSIITPTLVKVRFPEGGAWAFDHAQFYYQNKLNGTNQCANVINNQTIPASQYYWSEDTLVFDLRQIADFYGFDLDDAQLRSLYYINLYVKRKVMPTGCAIDHVNTGTTLNISTEFEVAPEVEQNLFKYSFNSDAFYLNTPNRTTACNLSFPNGSTITVTNPVGSFVVHVSSDKNINGQNAQYGNSWLAIPDQPNIRIDRVVVNNTGRVLATVPGSNIYQIGTHLSNNGNGDNYRVFYTLTSCEASSVTMYYDRTPLSGYPTSWADYSCSNYAKRATAYFTSKKGEIQMKSFLYNSPVDFCDDDTVQFDVINSQPVEANSIEIGFILPTGVDLNSGTAQIRYGGADSAWVDIEDPVYISGKYYWIMPDTVILPGIDKAPNNLLSLRVGYSTACGFYSGAQIQTSIDGNVGCGPVTTKTNSWPDAIEVLNLPSLNYYSNIKGVVDPITGCSSGEGYNYKLSLPITGIAPSGETDTIVVTLPPGYEFVSYDPAESGSLNAPQGQPRVKIQPDGTKWIGFQVTPGIAPGNSIVFTFKYGESTQSNKCDALPENITTYRTYQSSGLYCSKIEEECPVYIPNSPVDTIQLISLKPLLVADVQTAKYVMATCATPPCPVNDSVLIRGSITNIGSADLEAGEPIYMEVFLDNNNSGVIDAGDQQFTTFTSTAGLAIGNTLTIDYVDEAPTGGDCTTCEGRNLLVRFTDQVGGSGTQCLCDSATTTPLNTISYKGILCAGEAQGRIAFKPGDGAVNQYTYSIDDGVTYDYLNVFEYLVAGTYKLKMKKISDNTITSFDDVVFDEPDPQYFTEPIITDVTCNGYNDGKIIISSIGGNGTKTYTIIPDIGIQTSAGTFTQLTAQPYFITVIDENGCTSDTLVEVTEPEPIVVKAVGDQTICAGASTSAVTFTGNADTYEWEIDNSTIGLSPTTGTASIPAFTTVNAGIVPVVAHVTVTPKTSECIGESWTFAITVNPVPSVEDVDDVRYCGDEDTAPIEINGTDGTIFMWTNDNPDINLPIVGMGDIPSFFTTNNTTDSLVANIVVTPWIGDCSGPSISFKIVVDPTPYVDIIDDQAVCNGENTEAIDFTGVGTFNWTNSNTDIGLAATGTDDISAFTAENTGLVPITATIVVIPDYMNCTGQSKTFHITVNPVPVVTTTTFTATTCNNVAFSVTPVNGTDGDIPVGTKYSWPEPVVTGGMTGGHDGVLLASINGKLVNNTSSPQTATYTVTPSYSGCPGTPFTVEVTVNPKPVINNIKDTICSSDIFEIIPKDGIDGVVPDGTTYSWIKPNVTGGMTDTLPGIDQTSITSITGPLENYTTSNQTASYQVTPTYEGCQGTPFTVVVTVKSRPVINDMDQIRCSGNVFGVSPINGVDGVVPASTKYSWGVPVVTGGLTGGESVSNANNIYGTLYNPTMSVQTAVYSVTATSDGCDGDPFEVTITVYPTPIIHDKTATICSDGTFTIAPVHNVDNDTVPAGTTYSWLAPTLPAGVFGYASGTNQISVSGTLTNNTDTIQTVVYNVTAKSPDSEGGCPRTFKVTVTVDPKPVITTQKDTVCSESAFEVTPVTGGADIVPEGTTYSWAAPASVAGITGLTAGTDQTSVNGTLTNTTSTAITVTYNVTATPPVSVGACANTFTVEVTVDPTPVIADKIVTICNNETFVVTPVDGRADIVPAGTLYSWLAPTTPVELTGYAAGTDSAYITGTLVNTTDTVQDVVYIVTATTPDGCSSTFDVNVKVMAKPDAGEDITNVCAGTSVILTGVSTVDGTWSAETGNPDGAVLSATTAGEASVYFEVILASGNTYNFIYTANGCADTMSVSVDQYCCNDVVGSDIGAFANDTVTYTLEVGTSKEICFALNKTYDRDSLRIIKGPGLAGSTATVTNDTCLTYATEECACTMDTVVMELFQTILPDKVCDTIVAIFNIIDTEDPVIACPNDIIFYVDADAPDSIIQIPVPTATDGCGGVVTLVNDYTSTSDASGIYPQGVTTVTYTATDECGNTATCDFNVSVLCLGQTRIDGVLTNTDDNVPLPNVMVLLQPTGDTPGQPKLCVTNANGEYVFTGMTPGDYEVLAQDVSLLQFGPFYTESSGFFTTIVDCEFQTHNFDFQQNVPPVILGDFVWYDNNANGLQDEWFDSNGDGLVTQNIPNAKGIINFNDWEWIDLNGDGSYSGPENEGELNKAGLGTSTGEGITVTGPNGYTSQQGISALGYYRDVPTEYGDYTVTFDFTDELRAEAEAMYATGLVKTVPNFVKSARIGKAVSITLAGNVDCGVTTDNPQQTTLTAADPEDLTLDFGVRCVTFPTHVGVVEACPITEFNDTAMFTLEVADIQVDTSGVDSVSYYDSYSNAEDGIDALISPYISPDKTIWARIQDTATGSYNIDIVQLHVLETPVIDIEGTETICNEGEGEIGVNVLSGEPGYTYQWSNGETTDTITGLNSGTYSVIVTDVNGCTREDSFVIELADPLVIDTAVLSKPDCYGTSTGAIDLTVSGGTAPYQYIWSNGYNSEDLTDVPAGTYNVTVSDINGCSISSADYILEDTTEITITATNIIGSSCGGASGSVVLTSSDNSDITVGTITQASGSNFTGLAAGLYIATSTGTCEPTGEFVIPNTNSSFTATVAVTDVVCNGENNGTATITAVGGTGTLSYSLNGAVAVGTNVFAGLSPGAYNVHITDAENCSYNISFDIDEPDTLFIVLASKQDADCNAEGELTLVGQGGVAPYTFAANSGTVVGNFITGLSAGDVIVTITDANGCTAGATFTMSNEDVTAPTFTCPVTDTLYSDANCQVRVPDLTALVTDATDNCSPTDAIAISQTIAAGEIMSTDITVTLVVSDTSGNASYCDVLLVVLDTTAPMAICKDITRQLDMTGMVHISPDDIDNGSYDNCGLMNWSLDRTEFDCNDIGENTVILTVTDDAGNTSTCEATVTIEDNVAPVLDCPSPVELVADGNCQSEIPDFASALSNNNCGNSTVTQSPTAGSIAVLGVNSVKIVATDESGNIDTCWVDVTVVDETAPTFTCPETQQVYSDADCQSSVPDLTVLVTDAADNCSESVSVIQSIDAGTTISGDIPVTITVSDANGNSAECEVLLTVADSTPPVAICQNITRQLDMTGMVHISPDDIDNGSYDNCGLMNWSLDRTSFGCSDIGENTVILTVTDDAGNTSTCEATVTIEDNIIPILDCPSPVELVADENCQSEIPDFASALSNNNCGNATVTQNPLPGEIALLGVNTVEIVATDGSGNADTCWVDVTVVDETAPEYECALPVSLSVDPGECSATIDLVPPVASDNCDTTSILMSYKVIAPDNSTSGLIDTANGLSYQFMAGISRVQWTITDRSGNVAECEQEVEIIEDEAPVITCAENVIYDNTPDVCGYVVTDNTLDATATDNCGLVSLTHNFGAWGNPSSLQGATFPVGITEVVWIAKDASGNADTCTTTITVNDVQPPEFVNCRAGDTLTIALFSSACEGSAIWSKPIASDNCSGVEVVQTAGPKSGTPISTGFYTITYTATDASDNEATCSFTLKVIDTDDPIAVCPPDFYKDNDEGVCSWTAPEGSISPLLVLSNCPFEVLYNVSGATTATGYDDASGTVFNLGTSTVTYTINDTVNDQSWTCDFRVIVSDKEAPVVTCSAPITAENDNGECSRTITMALPEFTENCNSEAVSISYRVFEPDNSIKGPFTSENNTFEFKIGISQVEWFVADGAGNVATCMQEVTIFETEAPVIKCPAAKTFTFTADPDLCGTRIPGTALDASATDNCGIYTMSHNYGDWALQNTLKGAFFPVGSTKVTWTATDVSGNESSCTITVIVKDNEKPEFVNCPSGVTYTVGLFTDACDGGAIWSIPVARDNCSEVTVTQISGPAQGSILTTGLYNITYRAKDAAGNSTTCSFSINVIDTDEPEIVCQPNIYMESDLGKCSWTSPLGSLSPLLANSNCPAKVSWTITNPDGSVVNGEDDLSGYEFALGTSIVTYEIVETASNQSSNCSFTVSVEDKEAPVIECRPTMQIMASAGECSALVNLEAPISTDNCSGDMDVFYRVFSADNSISDLTPSDGSSFEFQNGTSSIEWIVIDAAGNESRCWQNVWVTPDVDALTPDAGVNSSICETETFSTVATVPDYATVLWTTSGTGSFAESSKAVTTYIPSANDIEDGFVVLTITSSIECANATDQIMLRITHSPHISAGIDDEICEDVSYQLDGAFISNVSSVIWSTLGSGVFSNADIYNPIYTPSQADIDAGKVDLVLRGISGSTCADVSDTMTLSINPLPIIDAGEDEAIYSGTTINLSVNVENGTGSYFYNWEPKLYVEDPNSNSTRTVELDAQTIFEITVTDANTGCVALDTKTVSVEESAEGLLKFFTGFSPNGDGVNDTWTIEGIEKFPENKVMFFNRWGDKVKELYNYNNTSVAWDGTNKKGDRLPDGTYYYLVELQNIDEFTGWVHIRTDR